MDLNDLWKVGPRYSRKIYCSGLTFGLKWRWRHICVALKCFVHFILQSQFHQPKPSPRDSQYYRSVTSIKTQFTQSKCHGERSSAFPVASQPPSLPQHDPQSPTRLHLSSDLLLHRHSRGDHTTRRSLIIIPIPEMSVQWIRNCMTWGLVSLEHQLAAM